MAAVPGGTFVMGCNTVRTDECLEWEFPAHEVTVPTFLMDRTEVTQADWERCRAAGAWETPECEWEPVGRARRAVGCVSWRQARTYCAWASKRLCTEAEWEFAARGGDRRMYPWGDDPPTCERALFRGCGSPYPTTVGTRPPTAFGLYDMAGNVTEFVEDDSHLSYVGAPADGSAWVDRPGRGEGRGTRGGSNDDEPTWLRATARGGIADVEYAVHLGVRCCK
jgi:formylglycine-generating enzyme required for sulfatase activity